MKIAVLRANALGDFIFSLPALEALRSAHPTAEIVLLGRSWHAEFVRDRPSPVDRVIPVAGESAPEAAGRERFGEAPWLAASDEERAEFGRAMRREAFDVAIQLHGGGRNSNPFVSELGAGLTVGMRSEEAPPLDRWLRYVYYQHEVARCLEVMGLIGVAPVSLEPRVEVTDADLAASAAVLPDDDPRPIAVLHPGASDPRRRWPIEAFAAMGDLLHDEGLRVVITGSDQERDLADHLARTISRPAENLAGRTSLSALVGVLARTRLMISNDSGPLHLGLAVGVDAVGIYWCVNLINGGSLTRGHHRPVASWRVACPACGVDATRADCPHSDSLVADAPLHEVLSAAHDLLEASDLTRGSRPEPLHALR